MSNKCLSCSSGSQAYTGPDGFKTLCKVCYASYRDCRLRLHVSPSGVSVRPSQGSSPARHLGFKSRQFFPKRDDFLKPIVEKVSAIDNGSYPPSVDIAASEKTETCIACGNDNSHLYPGPDGPTTLCATCNKRLSDCKLRLWRSSTGVITAKPSPDKEKVVAIGFSSIKSRRTMAQPVVRKAKRHEHDSLPSHRPKKLVRLAAHGKLNGNKQQTKDGSRLSRSTVLRASADEQEPCSNIEDAQLDSPVRKQRDASNKLGAAEARSREKNTGKMRNGKDKGDVEVIAENESKERIELSHAVRKLELRGRVVPISGMPNPSSSPSLHPKQSQKSAIEVKEHSTERLTEDSLLNESEGSHRPGSRDGSEQDPSLHAELDSTSPRAEQTTAVIARATKSDSGSSVRALIHSPASSSLLKSGPGIEALRSRAMSFGVKATCTYGWQTQRRYVSVAYGLRYLSFKHVLGEIFDMGGIPFAIYYVDDDGDEIVISEDSDMRPMFDFAKAKQGALRVRLRPP